MASAKNPFALTGKVEQFLRTPTPQGSPPSIG
jgi:hypothetical protein